MMNNENRDKEELPRAADHHKIAGEPNWRWRPRLVVERFIVVPCVLAGAFLGILGSVKLFGIDRALLPLVAAVLGGAGGAAFGRLVLRLIGRALEMKRNARQPPQPVKSSAQAAPEPTPMGQAVATNQPGPAANVPPRRGASLTVPLPGRKILARIAMICGGIGAISLFSIVGGLAPASFGSVVFTLLSCGAGALSYILGRRTKS